MTERIRILRQVSFRTKLVAIMLAVEAAVLGGLVWHASVIELQRVERDFQADLTHLRPLLNAALEGPIEANAPRTLERILSDSLNRKGTQYLVAKDRHGNVLAAAGADPKALPRLDAAFESAFDDRRYDTVVPLSSRGEQLGVLHMGVSIEREMNALDDALRDNIYRSVAAFLITLLLFLAVIQPFARRLGRLQQAAERIAEGDYAVHVDDADTDEVGSLARAFTRMSNVVRMRVDELEKSRQQFHAIADYTYDVECWVSPEGRLLWINSSVQRLTGYGADECLSVAQFPWFPVFDEDLVRVHVEYQRALRAQTTETGFEFRIVRKDGVVEWVSNSWQPIYGTDGAFLGLRLSFNSIQALKNVAQNLRAEQSRLLSLLSAMSFGVVFVDRGHRVVYANPAFTEVWSIPATQTILGLNLFYVLKHAQDNVLEQETF